MKRITIFCLALGVLSCNAQNSHQPSLDGKIFTINNYIDGKLDNSEDVVFWEGKMEGTVCSEYGFQGAPYQITKQDKEGLHFECTMHSKVEGKMVWKGIANGSEVNGTCLWTKGGQDPILFTFEGKLKS